MPSLPFGSRTLDDAGGLRYLQAVMLAPTDRAWRRSFVAICYSHDLERAAGENIKTNIDPIDVMKILRESPDELEIASDMEKAKQGGMAAGRALLLYFELVGLRAAMGGPAKEKFGIAKRAVADSYGMTVSWFDNIAWRNFRSVAHLWAAATIEAANGAKLLPCSFESRHRFLATAHRLQEFAVTNSSASQSEPLIRDDEIWKIPAARVGLDERLYSEAARAFGVWVTSVMDKGLTSAGRGALRIALTSPSTSTPQR